ncbi:MAG: PhoH family protein [Planctomycetota bacterium]
MPQERIPSPDDGEQRVLFGPMDRHLRAIRERFGVRITSRRGTLLLEGRDDRAVETVARRVRRVLDRIRSTREPLGSDVIEGLLFDAGENGPPPGSPPASPPGLRRRPAARQGGGERGAAGKTGLPQPLTPNQERYVRSIQACDVVFSIGPAGTGKTYLAVAEAVAALRAEDVRRLVLTRPAVEAGEKLGFLPGDFQAKINPYLRPLYDALGEFLPYGEVKRCLAHDLIEIVPFAYMRGRTLKDAFIILDEGQNTTPAQMKMFLTRMGQGSKMVVNGDVTQVDLPDDTVSGLVQAIHVLEGVKGVGVIRLGREDILRHPLVQRIVDAYGHFESPPDATGDLLAPAPAPDEDA